MNWGLGLSCTLEPDVPYKDPELARAKARERTLANHNRRKDDPEYRRARAERSKAWRLANPEKYAESRRSDSTKAYAKAWYQRKRLDPDYQKKQADYRKEYNSRPEVMAAKRKYRENRKNNPDVKRYFWERHILVKYGLVPEDVARMLNAQNLQCACCPAALTLDSRTHIDHDHLTGNVRGLLCDSCNLCIGKMRDSAETATRIAAYLNRV